MMQRSKKIAFVAHCLLNANAKVIGLARYAGVFQELIVQLIQRQCGIVQLPCPELQYMGLKRWDMTKEQYDFVNYRQFCRKLADDMVKQMLMYQVQGYQLVGLFAVDGSPTCGMNHSCAGFKGGCFQAGQMYLEQLTEERGIFMEELLSLIHQQQINIPYHGINEAIPQRIDW